MRATASLTTKLESNLVAYATAASAAGVGMMALTLPAIAEIVYTPAHIRIGNGGTNPYELDLNNDSVTEVVIGNYSSCDIGSCFYVLSANAQGVGNQIAATQGFHFALALDRGARIGPHKVFGSRGAMIFAFYPSYGTSYVKAGNWINVRNRYLGIRFRFAGETHYGWARLNAGIMSAGLKRIQITSLLTGYAYETKPNRPSSLPVSFISCALSTSITWEPTASRRRPAFSSHLVS